MILLAVRLGSSYYFKHTARSGFPIMSASNQLMCAECIYVWKRAL